MCFVEGTGVRIQIDDACADVRIIVEGQLDTSNVGALRAALDLACSGFPLLIGVDIAGVTRLEQCAIIAFADTAAHIHDFGVLTVEGATPAAIRLFDRTGQTELLAGTRPVDVE